MSIITIRGYWESLNEFYLEDTGECIQITPITYLVEEISQHLPGNAFINVELTETEVLVNGRYPETIINTTVVSFLFDEDIEQASSY